MCIVFLQYGMHTEYCIYIHKHISDCKKSHSNCKDDRLGKVLDHVWLSQLVAGDTTLLGCKINWWFQRQCVWPIWCQDCTLYIAVPLLLCILHIYPSIASYHGSKHALKPIILSIPRESLQMLGEVRGSQSGRDIESRRRTWKRNFTFSDRAYVTLRFNQLMPNAKLEAEVAGSRDY